MSCCLSLGAVIHLAAKNISICTVVCDVGAEGSDEPSAGLSVTVPAIGDLAEVVKGPKIPVKENLVSAAKGGHTDGCASNVLEAVKSVDSELCEASSVKTVGVTKVKTL